MFRKKTTSLLYDPEFSIREEHLHREINEINKEIGNIRVEDLETSISRHTRRDSGITSTRRTDERQRQRNVSPFDTKKRQRSASLDMGTRAKTQTYRVVGSMESEEESDDLGIRGRYVSQRKISRLKK